jgi:YVTN family beta-propeller protein
VALWYDSLTGAVYTANSFSDNVSVIDGATNVRRTNISVGVYPNLLTGSRQFGKVYCGNQNSSSISVISDSLLGVTGTPNAEVRAPNAGPTIVRGALNLQSAIYNLESEIMLLDISGRKVLDLRPGANDVSRLSPGVYFVRKAQAQAQAVRKVVLAK